MKTLSPDRAWIDHALREDIGKGDITTLSLLACRKHGPASLRAVLRTREDIVPAGLDAALQVFSSLDAGLVITAKARDGQRVLAGGVLAIVEGDAAAILAAERTALNLLQIISAMASLTRAYVDHVKGLKARIIDTRKTLPGLRALSKHAVRMGGGINHRMGLYDAILIKDNHIALMGGVTMAIAAARKQQAHKIAIECDTLEQVNEALDQGAEWILLDNMDCSTMAGIMKSHSGRSIFEASGNVTMDNVRDIALTGVDYISTSQITLNAGAVDIGLDIA